MKSVLISIKPKWCELIASGKKTVEVRKTKPKLETPFKVYIYQTRKPDMVTFSGTGRHISEYDKTLYYTERSGKVIGEFVCDNIINIVYDVNEYYGVCQSQTQIPYDELDKYLNTCMGYGWHISDLVIYDKPRELYDFVNYDKHEACLKKNCFSGDCWGCPNNAIVVIPPQSWCYVEVQE